MSEGTVTQLATESEKRLAFTSSSCISSVLSKLQIRFSCVVFEREMTHDDTSRTHFFALRDSSELFDFLAAEDGAATVSDADEEEDEVVECVRLRAALPPRDPPSLLDDGTLLSTLPLALAAALDLGP